MADIKQSNAFEAAHEAAKADGFMLPNEGPMPQWWTRDLPQTELSRPAANGEDSPDSGKRGAEDARKYELTHARCEPSHCLAPGLFRALKRGERKYSKLDVTHDLGDGRRVEFKAPEPLGADDLRVLQGLVALAGPFGKVLFSEREDEVERDLRASLKFEWEALHEPAIMVQTTYRQLAHEIGYADGGGSQIAAIQRSIKRLWTVSIIAESKGKWRGFRLLSKCAGDLNDGRLMFALNPMITQAVIGHERHIWIAMNEVRKIKNDTTRLVHNRLCGFIDPGHCRYVKMETLCSYVWPGPAPSPRATKKRKSCIREALSELNQLGWTIKNLSRTTFSVSRSSS